MTHETLTPIANAEKAVKLLERINHLNVVLKKLERDDREKVLITYHTIPAASHVDIGADGKEMLMSFLEKSINDHVKELNDLGFKLED